MKRILVADDSAAMQALAAAALAGAADFHLERAASGLEALRLLRTTEIDLVLTDVHMPELSGLELANFIKADPHLRRIPVIIVSTEADDADRARARAIGADEYLAKPFTPQALRNAIDKYISLSER